MLPVPMMVTFMSRSCPARRRLRAPPGPMRETRRQPR
jgi:hypothetical protein